ncbi:baeRF10 domain-containing protein [Tautonia rosea]|uniref:baeRF10 domain-containing protein n=1 Tax=Tautonia rosea TaxID=2728037 RepID=UPI001472B556|nr:Vms1/Ankzf1 family peptidyl-tRNA hydrolase [Tautonia rosea]
MFQEIDLRELAQHRGAERAYVSLYCSGEGGLGFLDRRERQIRSLLEDEPAELEHFDETMAMVRAELDERPPKASGTCLFACWADDLLRRYDLPVVVPELLRVDAAPYIRPLAELQDEHEDFLVVLADNSATRVLQITSAEVDNADRIKGKVKNRVKVGGWSQQRYARRRDKQLHHYAHEVAESLDEIVRDGLFTRVVLLGSEETMRAIEEALTPPVAEKLVGSQAIDLHADDRSLVEAAYALYEDAERASEGRLWEQIRAELFSGGLAVAGPEEVLAAALVGRVDSVIVARDAKFIGVRCRNCTNLSAGEPPTCPVCGSGSVFAVDLIDALARQLELTSATMEFTDPIPGLAKLGDLAALLRY